MNSFKIISDSSCDLDKQYLEKHDISLVPFKVSFDGKTYFRENIDITINEFYTTLERENVYPKTSLPSIQEYIDAFKPYLEQGQDILCFCLTSKFSGSYQSAVNAKAMLDEEQYSGRLIIIDSYNVTIGQGLIILEAAKMREAGYTMDQCAEAIEKLKHTVKITFTVNSLEYLKKGGRIGAVSALAGALLNIKPLAQMVNGELKPHSKIRGRNKAINEVVKIFMGEIGKDVDKYEFAILNSHCMEEANALKQQLESEHGIKITLPISNVGVTIGCHIGPSALGIAAIRRFDTV